MNDMQNAAMQSFFGALQRLDAGDATALKRSLGLSLSQAKGSAKAAFYKCCPEGLFQQEEAYFLAACGNCAFSRLEGNRVKFIDGLRQMYAESEGIEHRLMQLLDLPLDPSGYCQGKFGGLLRMMKQKGINVDFYDFLSNLCDWNAPDHPVQLQYAKRFYQKSQEQI